MCPRSRESLPFLQLQLTPNPSLQHLEIKCALLSVQVARLCEAANVGHVINNAYGVQSTALCKLVRTTASSLFRRWDTNQRGLPVAVCAAFSSLCCPTAETHPHATAPCG